MKKSILSFILCLSSIVVFSQNKYYTYKNAKALDTLFDDSKLNSNPTDQCVDLGILEKILGQNYVEDKYFSEENPFFIKKDKEGEGSKDFNTFLKTYHICEVKEVSQVKIGIRRLPVDTTDGGVIAAMPGTDIYSYYQKQKNRSSSSSSWQTAVLQGTADFMAQRFKDELTNFALNSFLNNLKKKDSLKFEALFPKTLNYINTYLDPNKNKGFYYSDLDMLRYAAELDLNNIVFQLPELMSNESVSKDKSNFLRFTSKIITRPEDYKNPAEIFDELRILNFRYYEKLYEDYIYPIDARINDKIRQAQMKGLDFVLLDNPRKKFELIRGDYKDLENDQIEEQLDLLDIFVNALKKEGEDESDIWIDKSNINVQNISKDLKVRFFYALLWEQTRNIKFNGEILSKDELIQKTNNMANSFKDLETAYVMFKEKTMAKLETSEYENLVMPFFEIIDDFTPDDTFKLENIAFTLFEMEKSTLKKDYQFVLPYLLSLLGELEIGEELVDKEFLNTISLIVNFTLVSNAEDMKNLLNTYALPIGSSSLKRTGKSDLSFNGYVGLTGGFEFANSSTNNSFFNLGLTAPIGLSLSHRYNSKYFISSGSIFLGFIDLGSLVNNSFDDNIKIQSDLSFQQFFVPSLGYFLNVKNSPFSFGMVGSYHFDSRALIDTPEADGIDVFRLNLSLLVDIPFFTLSHKN